MFKHGWWGWGGWDCPIMCFCGGLGSHWSVLQGFLGHFSSGPVCSGAVKWNYSMQTGFVCFWCIYHPIGCCIDCCLDWRALPVDAQALGCGHKMAAGWINSPSQPLIFGLSVPLKPFPDTRLLELVLQSFFFFHLSLRVLFIAAAQALLLPPEVHWNVLQADLFKANLSNRTSSRRKHQTSSRLSPSRTLEQKLCFIYFL